MRNSIAFAVLGLAFCGGCSGGERPVEFLSWYDGWGTHTVWGAGTVRGSYTGASVDCGRQTFPIRAIYDSHETDGGPVPAEQTSEYAKRHNIELLRSLEGQGIECAFERASAAEA
jgi:hypothetical protein